MMRNAFARSVLLLGMWIAQTHAQAPIEDRAAAQKDQSLAQMKAEYARKEKEAAAQRLNAAEQELNEANRAQQSAEQALQEAKRRAMAARSDVEAARLNYQQAESRAAELSASGKPGGTGSRRRGATLGKVEKVVVRLGEAAALFCLGIAWSWLGPGQDHAQPDCR